MKQSIFTSIIPLGEKYTLVYNSRTDAFVVTKRDSLCVDNLCDITSENLLRQFTDIGAIVDDGTDEVAALRKSIDEIDNDETLFHLHINPTLACNFNCWYCYEKHEMGSKMSDECIEAIYNLAKNVIENNQVLKHFSLSFFGGEPLMYFNRIARPIIEYISELSEAHSVGLNIHFTSNGFLLNDSIIDFLKQFHCSFQITLDGHRGCHDKVRHTPNSGSYDVILENIGKLLDHNISVIARINSTEENLHTVGAIKDDLLRIKANNNGLLNIDLQQVWQDSDTCDKQKVDEHMRTTVTDFEDSGFSISSNLTRLHLLSSCYGNKRNHVLINYNGDVFKCTARNFTTDNRYGVLEPDGHIKWNVAKLATREAARFAREVCHKCRIAPLCCGGCRQASIERPDLGKCLLGWDEAQINDIILNRLEQRLYYVLKQKEPVVCDRP